MNPKQEASKSGSASAAARMPKPGELYTGVFQSASTRGGFVIPQTPGISDIFIPNESLGAALHGDEVRVRILRLRPGRASEGEIERVLKHANKRIVGKFRRAGKVCIVTPKNQKLRKSVEIRRRFTEEEIPEGAWVIVDVETWAESPSAPLAGRITEVLGTEENRRLPILLLIREGGIQPEFPAEVEAEAEEIKKGRISEKEAARRRDFRNDRVMTIDPATAKDFDDAISLVERKRDGWRVAVHIADVAHYVTHGSKIDLEAYDRATSIYPVDRVIPMLPETLSNDLCSLRPGEDRLTTTAVFDVSREGKVSGIELCESMIHSARRFTYDEVQGLMDRADGIEHSKHPQPEIPSALLDDLLELRKASAALFAARMKRGALDLDMPETQILFDGRGIVAGLARKERIEAYRLIEDLMLSANEAVARELTRHEIPFLYRIHEPPSEDKLLALAPVLGRFGIQLPRKGHIPQSVLQQAIRKAQMNPAGVIVQRLVLRSLMRAQYQPGNTGHYGLASECYTHFTSPIRR
ncbi:VacB/RNase II family 3'-5' exoribonuclease, partial [Candidatus Sumerlaeota bacterium]|nr:VacB/RNase II family 3'-5' exoribonuclease [Candidatus Sumerlaeota bacterium]